MNPVDAAVILLLAILWDLTLGEPPSFLHPVVWIGRAIDFLQRRAPSSWRRLYGTCIAIFLICFIASMGYLGVELLLSFNYLLGILCSAFLLKSTFALKSLVQAADRVANSLEMGDIEIARQHLHWLCSRDASELTHHGIASAAIESCGENYVDAILSPVFYYTLFSFFGLGVFAALAFKVTSTLDSMIGYKSEPFKDIGFFAAKLDDLLNFPTARISIFLLSLASFSKRAIVIALRDGGKTASPNSGYPMAALAGALEVKLQKSSPEESYVLGGEFKVPLHRDIKRAVNIVKRASLASFAFSFIAFMFMY
ncbi:MAG: adenosylcobinamide-phosphate synthase CbiB [Methanocellales archaeon]